MPDIDRLISAIEAAESESYGSGADGSDGTLSEERAAALDAYFGRNTLPAPEGNSQVLSRDLFDTVEWILPSLTRIFAGADEVVKVDPIGPDDMEQAEQESLYLNHVVTNKNQWEQVFHDWAWDALVTKNAYCLALWDDSKDVEYETYARQSEDALALLLDEPGVEVLEHEAFPDEDAYKDLQQQYAMAMQQWQQTAMLAQQQGEMPPPQPEPPQVPMLHSVKIRRTQENGQVRLKVLPPERCLIHSKTPNYTLEECDFFEYWDEVSISSLRKMGLDVPDDIGSDDRGYSETQEDEARDLYAEDTMGGQEFEPAMRKVRARMVWIRHDYDDDGIAELQYCLVVGRTVLHREECNRIPVASIVATPVPHRHIGVSIADVVLDIQEIKTQMLRQGVDNLFHANNPRLFINEDKINLDDALISRPGGVVRGNQGTGAVFGNDIAPIVIPNVFPQAMMGLEYMDQVRENRTGTNRYFTGVDQNALNKTASGISQLSSASAQRVEQIARMMAPSVEYLFSCVHELILKHGHKRDVVRMKGEWVTVDPSNWKRRKDLKIAVGLGSGSRDAMMAHLQMILQNQILAVQSGMDLTSPELIYNTLAEMTKAAGFPTEGMFWKKPGPPKEPPPDPQVVKEQMRQQFEAYKLDKQHEFESWKVETTEANKAQIAELQSYTQQIIAAFKGYIDQQNQAISAELQQTKMATDSMQKDMERVSKAAERQPVAVSVGGGDETKAMLEEMAANFAARMDEISQRMDASRTIGIEKIKDPVTGKMIGGRVIQADGTTRDVAVK